MESRWTVDFLINKGMVVIRIVKPDLFMLVGIKHELEERLLRSVDVVTYREDMNTFLKKRIDREAVFA